MRNRRKAEIPTAQAKNMAMVRGRANFCASKADTYVAKEWYKSLAKAAHRCLQHLNKDIFYSNRRNLIAPGCIESIKLAVDNRNVEGKEGLQELETGEGQAPTDLQEINRDQSTEKCRP